MQVKEKKNKYRPQKLIGLLPQFVYYICLGLQLCATLNKILYLVLEEKGRASNRGP